MSGAAPRLLVVTHSKTGGARSMADAVLEGAAAPEIEDVEVVARSALEAEADDVRSAAAVILGTPENFGYMSGALKHFFDSVYYEVIEETKGLPYALFVKASTDGTGAVRSVERIVAGLAWRAVQPPLVVVGDVAPADLDRCRELGMTVAGGLSVGLY